MSVDLDGQFIASDLLPFPQYKVSVSLPHIYISICASDSQVAVASLLSLCFKNLSHSVIYFYIVNVDQH